MGLWVRRLGGGGEVGGYPPVQMGDDQYEG